METKICKKCGEEKKMTEYHKRKRNSDGYNNICKDCRKIETKDYYDNNKKNILIKTKIYRKNNREHYLSLNRKSCEKHKEKRLEEKRIWSKSENGKKSKKIYYKNNREILCEKTRIRRIKNSEKVKEYEKKKRSSPKYKEYMKNYRKKHRKDKPHIYAWRALLYNTTKRFGSKKESKTIDLLGYSATDLKEYIESQFIDGMSWDNWGEWHIDHIKPISSFEKDEKPSVVNSLDNLQPLWWLDNLKKGTKIII